METEPHLEALTQHVAGRLAVPGASAAAEVKVLMDSCSGITAMHARVVTSLGQECDIVTQSYPLHLMIKTPWGPVRFTMPFFVLSGGGDVLIIGQKTLTEKLGTNFMTSSRHRC